MIPFTSLQLLPLSSDFFVEEVEKEAPSFLVGPAQLHATGLRKSHQHLPSEVRRQRPQDVLEAALLKFRYPCDYLIRCPRFWVRVVGFSLRRDEIQQFLPLLALKSFRAEGHTSAQRRQSVLRVGSTG